MLFKTFEKKKKKHSHASLYALPACACRTVHACDFCCIRRCGTVASTPASSSLLLWSELFRLFCHIWEGLSISQTGFKARCESGLFADVLSHQCNSAPEPVCVRARALVQTEREQWKGERSASHSFVTWGWLEGALILPLTHNGDSRGLYPETH